MADVHSCRHHAEDMVEQAHWFYFHIQTIWPHGQNMFRAFFSKTRPSLQFQSYLMASSIWYLKIISKVEKQCRLGIRTFWIFLVFWLVMWMPWRCILYVLAFHDKPAVTFLINEKRSSVKQWQMSYLRKTVAIKMSLPEPELITRWLSSSPVVSSRSKTLSGCLGGPEIWIGTRWCSDQFYL